MDINVLRSITTLLSFAVFLGIVWWTFRKGSGKIYEDAANLPFNEEEDDVTPMRASR